MAFIATFRRTLSGSSGASQVVYSQFGWIRRNSACPFFGSKLFVCGLSPNATDESLFHAFAPFGRLLDAKVVRHRFSGQSKRFGFIIYETDAAAEKAQQEMHLKRAKCLDDWLIYICRTGPRDVQPRGPAPPPEAQALFKLY